MSKHRWQSYLHVQAWWALHGAFEHRVRTEMQRAALANAPIRACYLEPNGSWVALEDVADELLREQVATKVKEILEQRRGGDPQG